VGTSSWKYEGWLGLIYTPDRYMTRGKLSRAKFEKTCLVEYAETFKTVCADAGYYQFPSTKMLDGYFSQLPPDFKLSIKVTEDITVKQFPNLPRYGKRAGQPNERFLDADLFASSFLTPLEPYRSQIGTLFFEFSPFHHGDWELGRQFVAHLDEFLDKLPKPRMTACDFNLITSLCFIGKNCLSRQSSRNHKTIQDGQLQTVNFGLTVQASKARPARNCCARLKSL
jgi:uncharacterized protein YecE (DUF72 family)